MSEMESSGGRKPRSALRRAQAEARPGVTPEQLHVPARPKPEAVPELVLFPAPAESPEFEASPTPRPAPMPEVIPFPRRAPRPEPVRREAKAPPPAFDVVEAWEDTSTVLEVPEHRTFFAGQPPIFWVVAALLMVAMFTLIFVVGVDGCTAAEAARAEARRLQQIADEKARYKLLYRDLIEGYADAQALDPALVAAVIYNESRFDPTAVSRVGARGLMQIMETTGTWIAEKLGEQSTYTQESLFTPDTNIRFGTWYLGFLSRMFDGDIVKMAAGYHAGQNKVLEWLDNPEYSPDGTQLVKIPYPDTEQYVSRVVNAYEIYIRHYYTPEETAALQVAS